MKYIIANSILGGRCSVHRCRVVDEAFVGPHMPTLSFWRKGVDYEDIDIEYCLGFHAYESDGVTFVLEPLVIEGLPLILQEGTSMERLVLVRRVLSSCVKTPA